MDKHFDLIVAGGGFAGAAAAISAARQGMNVLLFDINNSLGGAASDCLINPFMPWWTKDPETKERIFLSAGIFEEIRQKLENKNALTNRIRFNEEILKIILNRMAVKAGVNLLFHSYLIDAKVDNGKLKSVTVANLSGKQTYTADYFIDATGDGTLCAMCGCEYQLGRENDNLCQPMTLCFRVANVDIEKFNEEKEAMQKMYLKYKEDGKINCPRENILCFQIPAEGIIHFNTTRIVKRNPVDIFDVTQSEIEAREQAYEIFTMLKENFEAFKNSDLISTAPKIGARESRKIIGEYVLTKEDLLSCTKFDDGIAACNYDIDIHNPEGAGTSHYYFPDGEYYTIPYRCLTPKGLTNTLVAGRCISSTHEAQASYRIMPVCCCLGEAAGVAASIAHKSKQNVKEIDTTELRNKLKELGAIVD